jgi:hypothetical protein
MILRGSRPALLAAVVLVCVGALARCGSNNSCNSNADCVNSEAAQQAGRCGPEFWCEHQQCRAACKQLCTTVSSDFNACSEGLVCNQSRNSDPALAPSFCTRLPVPCATADDCPNYRPPTDGGQADWWCEANVCRYPGFDYAVP